MSSDSRFSNHQFKPIDDDSLVNALNELSRSINIATTYGHKHPAVEAAVVTAEVAMNTLFSKRAKVTLGTFNAMLTVDESPVIANGTLLKSFERRLTRLRITGLNIKRGIKRNELIQLIELLSCKEADCFQSGIEALGSTHLTSKQTEFKAVQADQTVANTSDLTGAGGNGVLVLDEELDDDSEADTHKTENADVHVGQIIAFLKGDGDSSQVGEELTELASDPARLGKMIMESVAIRQTASNLSGESLGDIVLGCLRRTYTGLHNQPAFKSADGKADLHKSLLLLEENLLERMRDLTGDADAELDREIVQAVREMEESLNFEIAAMQYMEHREAIEENKHELQRFIESRGAETAEGLISGTNFPSPEWRRIVAESGKETSQIANGLNTLTTVFERLENLMKSDRADGASVKDLLGEASENLDDTIFTTKEKLDVLSQQLKDGEIATIGGHGRNMTQDELLAALAEVAQELMQPLTAITASLEMMLQGFVGDITTDQRDLLGLAANSGEHLKYLMRELINIVGCPANKGVDSRYHTTSEEVVLMQEDVEGQEHLPLNFFQ
ncbi:hypothetical protein P4C99_16450 [Pontiellaceae bacterium B1224]|nr:hypothetical protein [Pontiellaceae bacterium B1224]